MKRQESTLRSSSSRRFDNTDHSSVHHAVDSTGCMAGVFRLISSNYLTRRKFLTFGKKQTASFSFSCPQQPNPKSPARKGGRVKNRHRLINDTSSNNACDEIPPEIRTSSSLRSEPSVVARLMGLEHAPPATTASTPRTPDSAAEKRRKLLGALEKCDGNLQELRRIIEAVRSVDGSEAAPPLVSTAGKGVATNKCSDQKSGVILEQEQPSPVSVLEDFTESPPPSSSSPTSGWYSAKRTENANADICHVVRQTPQQQQQRKKPGKDKSTEIASFSFHGNSQYSYKPRSLFHPSNHRIAAVYPPPSSTMVEAVNEACRDVEMGQRREIEKVGVVIEDFVYKDLIQELIKELVGCCRVYSTSLPFEKCKRKLCF